MSANPAQARELFVAAVKLAPDLWDAYLKERCGPDVALCQRVQKLLVAHREAGSFLEPAIAVGETAAFRPEAERPGTAVGPYKLLEKIGEGGFGIVYMAEQTRPVRRKVALKILRLGMDSRQVVARFEAERQALALMDHPNIARVFDGGTTDDAGGSGRPYFVMELVKGVPVTQYCDEQKLTPRQRLELFLPVCQAVQHAHQKGIIHRDLKPTNVLVTRHDTTPVVKVIDFGVAKALGQELTDKTLFTGISQLIGTPLYMSPEQAGMSDLDVDTRSDVYSLGVLLYELLTGTTPFDKDRFKRAAYDEIRRIIREEEPPKPSTRLSELRAAPPPRAEAEARSAPTTLDTVSALRQTEPVKLTRLVRGELDWIAMKCLEKDRSRRYETANALAQDVERYLRDQPVQACPPSAAYRFRKFARRNRSAFLVTSVAAGSAVAGLVLTVVLLAVHSARIREERDNTDREFQRAEGALVTANENLQRADQNLALALESLDDVYMKDVEDRVHRDHRLTASERDSLKRGLAFYDRFTEQNKGHPELQGVMAKAYRRAGFLRLELKDWKDARTHFTAAIPTLETLSADSVEYRVELARCCYGLSLALAKVDRHQEAAPPCRRAIDLLKGLVAQVPHEPTYRVQLGHALWQLTRADEEDLLGVGRQDEAQRAARESLATAVCRRSSRIDSFNTYPYQTEVVVVGKPTGGNWHVDAARFLATGPLISLVKTSPAGGGVTLTATPISGGNPGASITQVTFFYYDSAGNKVTLGNGTPNGAGGWRIPVNLPNGTTVFAQALDSLGAPGDTVSISV
jgi:serine/threonine protein kinase